jgi:hypothetical protein
MSDTLEQINSEIQEASSCAELSVPCANCDEGAGPCELFFTFEVNDYGYEILTGPDNYRCVLGRARGIGNLDLPRSVTCKLNEQQKRIRELEAEVASIRGTT